MAAVNTQHVVEADALLEDSDSGWESVDGSRRRSRRAAMGAASAALMVAAVVAVANFAGGSSMGTQVGSSGIVGLDRTPEGHEKLHGNNTTLRGQKSHHKEVQCSWPLQNCTDSKCCMKGGQQCFAQNSKTNYSTCKYECAPGPHVQHWDGEWWTCDTLGERTEGNSHCSKPNEDCSNTMCCEDANTQCFEKSAGWATCKSSCDAGAPDMHDVDGNFWSCKKLGPWTQGAAPWVQGQCAPEGEDCSKSKCCSNPSMQCYSQNDDWASCRYDCTPGKLPGREWEPAWSCDEIGMRTPGLGAPTSGVIGEWAAKTCAWSGDDCSKSRCCIGMNQQCFEKNDDYAVCKEFCTPGVDLYDNNETWSCRERGPRSQGLAVKGSPSLYCWSLFQTTSYENDIMVNQMAKGLGIFQCDDWALLSTDDETVIGKTLDGKEAKTKHVEWAEITQSVDGTAGNAKLFINCWNVIVQEGYWNNYAWTVKVDPDAVLLPDRLRGHLSEHVLENVYVVNCNKFPSSPNFPMMYGSLEIYSWKAIQTYANGMGQCMSEMGAMIPLWGEDYFMTHCLDSIGVGRINDFASVGDATCLGANCGDGWVAAFHPFKSVGDWQQCWNDAHR